MVSFNDSAASLPTKDPQTKTTYQLCSVEHHLSDCKKFRTTSPEKRLEIVKEKRLCFNCFEANMCHVHAGMQVPVLLTDAGQNNPSFYTILCSHQVEGSDRREDHAVEQQDIAGDEDQLVKGHIRACGPSQSETTKIALPIFSVKVKAKGHQEYVQTYAFLDSETT